MLRKYILKISQLGAVKYSVVIYVYVILYGFAFINRIIGFNLRSQGVKSCFVHGKVRQRLCILDGFRVGACNVVAYGCGRIAYGSAVSYAGCYLCLYVEHFAFSHWNIYCPCQLLSVLRRSSVVRNLEVCRNVIGNLNAFKLQGSGILDLNLIVYYHGAFFVIGGGSAFSHTKISRRLYHSCSNCSLAAVLVLSVP